MYKKTTNKDRVLSQIDFVIGEMKFAIETQQKMSRMRAISGQRQQG